MLARFYKAGATMSRAETFASPLQEAIRERKEAILKGVGLI